MRLELWGVDNVNDDAVDGDGASADAWVIDKGCKAVGGGEVVAEACVVDMGHKATEGDVAFVLSIV